MADSRFGTQCVIRAGQCSGQRHGDETVPTRPERVGGPPAAWHAHAGAWRAAGRGGAGLWGQPPDRDDLATPARRRSPGVAASAIGSAGGVRCQAAGQAAQVVVAGRGRERLSDRAVDAAVGGDADRTRVRPRLQHLVRLAGAARSGVLGPAPGGAHQPARRGGDPRLEGTALAGTKKTPAAAAAPSSSSTNPD